MNNFIANFFGNMTNFKNQYDSTKAQLDQAGSNPQQVVQQMLDEGKMTQEQFNVCRNIVNSLMGSKN